MKTHHLIVIMILLGQSVTGFILKKNTYGFCHSSSHRHSQLFSSISFQLGISRIKTLQTLLWKYGVPGASICSQQNDLEPVSSIHSDAALQLHPYLLPLARSTKNPDYFVCALRRPNSDHPNVSSSSLEAPWPIVESKIQGPGYSLLSLNSEHLMRRIAAHADFIDDRHDLLDVYNQNLGQGILKDRALDTPYERGSVKKLGYGLDKYILLRVGPFPDLYINMSRQHFQRADESSCLIAAEAANAKFTGFASTFLNYSKLLSTMTQRDEEARDAARVCLRLPLSSIGMEEEDFIQTAIRADLVQKNKLDKSDVLGKMLEALEKIRENEKEDVRTRASMTPTQIAMEEANYLLDRTSLNINRDWNKIRTELSQIYSSVGMNDMAAFVNSSFQ